LWSGTQIATRRTLRGPRRQNCSPHGPFPRVSHREMVGQQVLILAQGLVNELAQLGQRVEERNTTPLVVSSFEIAEKSLTRWEGLVVGYFEIVGKKLQITSQVQSRIAPLLSQVRKASGRLPRGHLPES
jgi:hypothetical protein